MCSALTYSGYRYKAVDMLYTLVSWIASVTKVCVGKFGGPSYQVMIVKLCSVELWMRCVVNSRWGWLNLRTIS